MKTSQTAGAHARERDGRPLTLVHLVRPDFATRYRALSGVLSTVDAGEVEGDSNAWGRSDSTMNRWWSRSLRDELFGSLESMTESRVWAFAPLGQWTPNDYCLAAGGALIAAIRDELGFGLNLTRRVLSDSPGRVDLLTDNDMGLRLGVVLNEAGHLLGVRTRVRYLGLPPRGDWMLRLPSYGLGRLHELERLTKGASGVRTMILSKRLNLPDVHEARPQGNDPVVAFFESNPRGWPYSIPVMQQLRSRGIDAVPLVTSPRDGELVRRALGRDAYFVPQRRISRSLRSAIGQHVSQLSVNVDLGSDDASHAAEVLIRTIVRRRLATYLPTMEAAVDAARMATDGLGARATHQFSHGSPAGRAFLIQAQMGGAHTFATPHGSDVSDPPSRPGLIAPDTTLAWGASPVWKRAETGDVRVTGNHIAEERILDVRRALARRPEGPPLVLVAFGRPGRIVSPEVFASAVRLVAAAAASRPVMRFVASIHPRDTREFWVTVLSSPAHEHMALDSGRIYELMGNASSVVTMHSTAGGEAICAGIPVVCINSHLDPDTGELRSNEIVPEYLVGGAAYSAKSVDELCRILDHICQTPRGQDRLASQRVSYASAFLRHSTDGDDAASRIADAIEERL